jgi:hypothetical protein
MFMKPVKMFSCLSRYTTKLYFHPKQNFRDFFLVIEEIIVFAFDFQKLSSIIVFLKMYLLQKNIELFEIRGNCNNLQLSFLHFL